MERVNQNRKIYRKAVNLYIGEAYEEMLDEHLLSELRMKIAYNSAYLHRFLQRNPKVVVVKSFDDLEKNSLILNTIVNKCPSCKILLIGGSTEQYKKNLAERIDIFLPQDTDYEAFKTAFEALSFKYSYGEDINESVLEFNGINPLAYKILWFSASIAFILLSTSLYFLFE